MRHHRHSFRELVGRSITAAVFVLSALPAVAGSAVGAESAASPEAFVNRFVAAVNSKEPGQITALVDSRSLACLTGESAELLSDTIANWTKNPISPGYHVQLDDLGPDAPLVMDAFMPGRFDYPARPTRKVQISTEATTGHGTLLLLEIGVEAGAWKIVLGCPKAGTMAWIKQERAEKEAKTAEQGKVADALVAGMSPDYRAELVSMAKAGRWIDAVHKIEKDRQVELTIAVLVMKILAPPE
jgi:hypothetical protein